MEIWRKCWRAVAPLLPTVGLVALRQAVVTDDPRLIQGGTTSPPPLVCVLDWPVEAACLLGYCGWQGDGLVAVDEVEEYFARKCYELDELIGEEAGCRHLLNWYDDSPRDEVFRELLPEIDLELSRRERTDGEATQEGGGGAAGRREAQPAGTA